MCKRAHCPTVKGHASRQFENAGLQPAVPDVTAGRTLSWTSWPKGATPAQRARIRRLACFRCKTFWRRLAACMQLGTLSGHANTCQQALCESRSHSPGHPNSSCSYCGHWRLAVPDFPTVGAPGCAFFWTSWPKRATPPQRTAFKSLACLRCLARASTADLLKILRAPPCRGASQKSLGCWKRRDSPGRTLF